MQNNRYIYWLGDMSIHSRLKCFLSVFFKSICSHGHNWDICFSIIAECPNLSVQLIILNQQNFLSDKEEFPMKSIDYTEIGQKIRQSRIAHSYSQEQLAELTGISTAFLGHIERGTRAMSLETLVSLCSVLNISIDYLLLDEIPETDSEITALLSEVKSKGDIQYRKFVNIMKALTLVADKL